MFKTAIAATLLCFVSAQLYGDGLDLDYFVRVPMMEFHSAAYITAIILGVTFVNYALNFLIIGVPAICWGGAFFKPVAMGLITLTILGQVADRLGAILGFVTGMVLNTRHLFVSTLVLASMVSAGSFAVEDCSSCWCYHESVLVCFHHAQAIM